MKGAIPSSYYMNSLSGQGSFLIYPQGSHLLQFFLPTQISIPPKPYRWALLCELYLLTRWGSELWKRSTISNPLWIYPSNCQIGLTSVFAIFFICIKFPFILLNLVKINICWTSGHEILCCYHHFF